MRVDKEKFGQLVFAHRVRLGLTAKELASAIGTTDQSVTNWEIARHFPTSDHLESLIAHLGEQFKYELVELEQETAEISIADAVYEEEPADELPVKVVRTGLVPALATINTALKDNEEALMEARIAFREQMVDLRSEIVTKEVMAELIHDSTWKALQAHNKYMNRMYEEAHRFHWKAPLAVASLGVVAISLIYAL